MHPEAAEKIAHVVVEQYRRCSPGHATTFHMMFGLVAALTGLPWGDAMSLTISIFPKEAKALDEVFTRPVHPRHAARHTLHFPELN